MDIIKSAWNVFFLGSPCFIWESKLKNVKKELKKWAKEHYQGPSKGKIMKLKELGDLQQRIEKEQVSEEILRKKKTIHRNNISYIFG